MNPYGLYFETCIKMENDIWFSATNYNGLYRYNLKDKIVKKVALFPNEEMWQMDLYHNMCRYQNLLVFIPHYAERISIYDMKTEVLRQIELPISYKPLNFLGGVVYHDMLYMFGYKYPGIIKVDLNTGKHKVIYETNEVDSDVEDPYFGDVATEGNYVYIPCQQQNSVLILDMDYDAIKKKSVGKGPVGYSRIVKDGQVLYLLERDTNNLVLWDIRTDIWYEVALHFEEPYVDAHISYNSKYIWIVSIISGEVYIVEKETGKKQKIHLKNLPIIEYIAPYENGIYFVNGISGSWYFLDDQGIVTDLHLKIKEQDIETEEMWQGFLLSRFGGAVLESFPWPLEYLVFHARMNRTVGMNQVNAGNRIWNYIQ